MLDDVGWNLLQSKFFIQHFLVSNTKNTPWIRLKWFISNVDFNVFERSNVYSNVFIKNNKRLSY